METHGRAGRGVGTAARTGPAGLSARPFTPASLPGGKRRHPRGRAVGVPLYLESPEGTMLITAFLGVE